VYGNGTIFKFLLTALMVTESLSTIVQGQNYDLECVYAWRTEKQSTSNWLKKDVKSTVTCMMCIGISWTNLKSEIQQTKITNQLTKQ